MRAKHTNEERIQIVIVHLGQLQEVLTSFRACFNLEIDNDVPERSLEEKRHGGWTMTPVLVKWCLKLTRRLWEFVRYPARSTTSAAPVNRYEHLKALLGSQTEIGNNKVAVVQST